MPTRTAKATWEGTIKAGKGYYETPSGSLRGAYSFGSRFENGQGSNPEELLAAAEAACFSMALSLELEKAGKPPKRIETEAACSIEKEGAGFAIKTIRLSTRAEVPNLDPNEFAKIAETVKKTCPVSRALAGVELEVTASLI